MMSYGNLTLIDRESSAYGKYVGFRKVQFLKLEPHVDVFIARFNSDRLTLVLVFPAHSGGRVLAIDRLPPPVRVTITHLINQASAMALLVCTDPTQIR